MPLRRGARCRGFSLIELLVVMLIVGIIAGGASLGIDAARANDTELATEHLRRALEAGFTFNEQLVTTPSPTHVGA